MTINIDQFVDSKPGYSTLFLEDYFILNRDSNQKENVFSETETKKTCAKVVVNLKTQSKRYYILMKDGYFIDPYAADYRISRKKHKWNQVNRAVYDFYEKYIRTASRNYLNRALREIASGGSATRQEIN